MLKMPTQHQSPVVLELANGRDRCQEAVVTNVQVVKNVRK